MTECSAAAGVGVVISVKSAGSGAWCRPERGRLPGWRRVERWGRRGRGQVVGAVKCGRSPVWVQGAVVQGAGGCPPVRCGPEELSRSAAVEGGGAPFR